MAPNPVGYNRVYVHSTASSVMKRGGRTSAPAVSSSPTARCCGPTSRGSRPAASSTASRGKELEVEIGLSLSFADPVSYLDIIQDGKIKHSVRLDEFVHNKGRLPKLTSRRAGGFSSAP